MLGQHRLLQPGRTHRHPIAHCNRPLELAHHPIIENLGFFVAGASILNLVEHLRLKHPIVRLKHNSNTPLPRRRHHGIQAAMVTHPMHHDRLEPLQQLFMGILPHLKQLHRIAQGFQNCRLMFAAVPIGSPRTTGNKRHHPPAIAHFRQALLLQIRQRQRQPSLAPAGQQIMLKPRRHVAQIHQPRHIGIFRQIKIIVEAGTGI